MNELNFISPTFQMEQMYQGKVEHWPNVMQGVNGKNKSQVRWTSFWFSVLAIVFSYKETNLNLNKIIGNFIINHISVFKGTSVSHNHYNYFKYFSTYDTCSSYEWNKVPTDG